MDIEIWETEAELFSGLERPAITYHENIIYFFEDRKMFTYDLKAKQLKEYEIDLSLKYSSMYYYDNKLYIFGGRVETAYSNIASSKVYNIDLENFKNTEPVRTKIFKKEITLAKANE
ncbi:hypothetical protein [Flavobacterium sp. 245]|uniref:hypothetical protein n=1 Tax=Flavobacterium sp. 245 TaxID=2512115 RepID=UPI0010F00E47|nr:hypothetical protein [Flavobacterium sp. 245]TDO94547.1 hypothetical protein EV145_11732 [Flavobacterium sp. 245]